MEDGVVNMNQVGVARLTDVSTIALDETIGRLCVEYAKETRIAAFDFAGAPIPGKVSD